MTKKQTALCKKLVNVQINEILSRYAGTEQGKCYLVRLDTGFPESIVLSPTYDTGFYYIDEFIKIANACGMSHYVGVSETINHEPTPKLVIY